MKLPGMAHTGEAGGTQRGGCGVAVAAAGWAGRGWALCGLPQAPTPGCQILGTAKQNRGMHRCTCTCYTTNRGSCARDTPPPAEAPGPNLCQLLAVLALGAQPH